MHLLASTPAASAIAITFATAAGVVGAIIALLKLKPEANSEAVSQAQGAMETMVALQAELRVDLARAKDRADRESDRADRLQAQLANLQERYDNVIDRWGPFPADVDQPA